ncbi:MAG: sucrose phosphorylase [Bacteroidales bacterium]|jgi:sucrose phosphorylase|nr:sucrose phosphorylase [Bacteroidales bacterium]
MFNKVQLITYVERFGCNNMAEFTALVGNELKGLVAGVHLLPFFYPFDGEDAGFDPIDHLSVDPRLGKWMDINELSGEVQIMADLIVNHVSAKSMQFKDYLRHGEKSKYANLFLSYDKVFPEGAAEIELSRIYRPRPGFPFTAIKFDDGTSKSIWTTFTGNQIDIDVKSTEGINYLEEILTTFQQVGIKMIRLDAAGYAIKKRGTSCFMIPETFEFIDELKEKARQKGIEVLVEVHSHYKTQIEIAKKVDYVYDFALPVLVLDTIFNQDASNLRKWLKISPRNAFTVLDTHDGIGIVDVAEEGDNAGLIESSRLDNIVEQIHINTQNQSKRATGAAASNLDLYQVNCTYYDALGRNDKHYLLARAIQFFAPGIPQVYYVGLLAGENDMELLAKTNVGRDINRHYYSKNELRTALQKPVVKRLKELILFRNSHPAFQGEFVLHPTESNALKVSWENHNYVATLFADLKTGRFEIICTDISGKIIIKSF